MVGCSVTTIHSLKLSVLHRESKGEADLVALCEGFTLKCQEKECFCNHMVVNKGGIVQEQAAYVTRNGFHKDQKWVDLTLCGTRLVLDNDGNCS